MRLLLESMWRIVGARSLEAVVCMEFMILAFAVIEQKNIVMFSGHIRLGASFSARSSGLYGVGVVCVEEENGDN